MKDKKFISLSLAVLSLVCILCGCGSSSASNSESSADTDNSAESSADTESNEFTFRDIPFGLEYSKVIDILEEDLKQQGYYEKPEKEKYSDNSFVVTYRDVKLYDYDASIYLNFYKPDVTESNAPTYKQDNNTANKAPVYNPDSIIEVDDDELSGAIFGEAEYYIHCNSDKDRIKCYKFFSEELAKKYGIGKVDGNTINWEKEKTQCEIETYTSDLYGYKIYRVNISYGYKSIEIQKMLGVITDAEIEMKKASEKGL